MQLSLKVAAAIERFFPQPEATVAAELLAKYGDAPHEREAERIHLLILKISRRDVNRVRDLVDAAKRDYRDVIAWASQRSRIYIVGLLRKGPNAHPHRSDTLKLSSLEKWKRTGSIVIGGLSPENGDFRGLYIFTLGSIDEAQALVSDDPAIQSGSLRFEFHTWLTADSLQVGIPKDYLDIDIH
jgi:hypothetical protein